MSKREYWPPAIVARSLEKRAFGHKKECSFDLDKNKHIILIPGMGASVQQLFGLVTALRSDNTFQEYGVTAVELGLSLGDFSVTLELLLKKIEQQLLTKVLVKKIVLYAHSHGGRFASEVASYLQKKYPDLDLVVITGGTPIEERPTSLVNWVASLAFRQWPGVTQPQLDTFFALYSTDDAVVSAEKATTGSTATLIELEGFSHSDFKKPGKVIPHLKYLLNP